MHLGEHPRLNSSQEELCLISELNKSSPETLLWVQELGILRAGMAELW